MEMLQQVLEFAAKGFIVFLVFAASMGALFTLGRRRRTPSGHVEVRRLNARFEALADPLRAAVMGKKAFKAHVKARPKPEPGTARPRVYVLDFEGDLLA